MTIENMMEGQKPANLYFRYIVIEKFTQGNVPAFLFSFDIRGVVLLRKP